MSTVNEIKAAIERLSLEDRAELARWMHGWADDEWDRQIERDAASGRLNEVVARARREIASGQLRELP